MRRIQGDRELAGFAVAAANSAALYCIDDPYSMAESQSRGETLANFALKSGAFLRNRLAADRTERVEWAAVSSWARETVTRTVDDATITRQYTVVS